MLFKRTAYPAMARRPTVNVLLCFVAVGLTSGYKLAKNDEKCPEVRARSKFDLDAVRMCYALLKIVVLRARDGV